MRNIIQLAHISLDGFMAGSDGDMSFITMNEEIADHVYPLIDSADTAVYGRTTYQMMDGYWPAVVDSKEATAHERKHARWYMNVAKIVASRTLPAGTDPKVRICKDDIVAQLAAEKRRPGGDIMIFASPTLVHTLFAHDLIDEWRLNVQPVVIGRGLPLFAQVDRRIQLELRSAKTFSSGVIATHYVTKR
ncbi:MAG TPA: dihydrofolate reductase family protein [Kofleriaceae bacterium]|nr:dihydrofolate reductase family protein [Kofleriaceae bacterium]